ncbi:hypothetical protein N7520_004665 [Penicillium odoratum]|uniref:uncharacterized protein n=1 Tax=Penicillium odoratum TaxID=1167516 RepID=UPI002548511B|nr:uncharacterized protein N7520_004665 [Penicillium odoratum]KAJ5765106.1 hypothetical protein N7520_004665 [Penicillium odoratum]
MEGTVIITGASGSVAIEAVQQFLLSHPRLMVVGTIRNKTKASNSPHFLRLQSIEQNCHEKRLVLESLDLESLQDVRSFADRIAARVTAGELPPISAIICNAFTWSLEGGQKFSSDHYESTFQVNHLTHYLLVLKLLPSMSRQAGRIIMLSSEVHDPKHHNPLARMGASLPANGNLEELVKPSPDSLGTEYDMGWRRYANSKLANVMFMHSLNQRLQNDPLLNGITALAMDPGAVVDSRAHEIHHRFINKSIFALMKFLHPVLTLFTKRVRTNAESGRDLAALAADSKYQFVRGYFDGQRATAPTAVVTETDIPEALWSACWDWTNMEDRETCLPKHIL